MYQSNPLFIGSGIKIHDSAPIWLLLVGFGIKNDFFAPVWSHCVGFGIKNKLFAPEGYYSCTTRSRSSASLPLFQRLVVPTR